MHLYVAWKHFFLPCSQTHTSKNVSSLADLLPAMDGDTKTMTFLQEVVDILMAYIVESFDRETKVIDFHYPNELLQMNNWELQDEPATLDDILISCRATLKYAIKTGRPQSDTDCTIDKYRPDLNLTFPYA